MSYMRSIDSAVLQEFGRILEEKEGLKKMAQAAPGAAEQAWEAAMQHGPNTSAWKHAREMFAGDATKKALMDKADYVYLNESENDALAWKKVFEQNQPDQMAKQPAPGAPGAPVAAAPPARAALSAREKTAEGKAYDVTPKENMIQEAHPQPAKVCGNELVENKNEQQDADLAVAEKSAKDILVALYKLAKRLKAENNEKAYELVKETFLDLSKSLKK